MELAQGVSVLVVFAQGLLSFFSPCVLPIVPLYAAYLTGTEGATDKAPSRGHLLVNTLFFVLGIGSTFFILGAGATAVGIAFMDAHNVISKVGGVVIIALGMLQFFLYGKSEVLSKELRLPFKLERFAMNPLVAFALGFFFSFAWTPCVGPVLTSVLIMAASSASAAVGFMFIGVYTLGFAIPFLLVGLLADVAVGFFRTHRHILHITVKVGAVLLIVMGVLIITGQMDVLSRQLATFAR